MNLQGQVVLITGASSGLGAQLGRSLVAAGARPVLVARRAERLAALQRELGGAVETMACDVTVETDRQQLIDTVVNRHGRLDGLVNNAGMGASGPALRTPADTCAQVIE